MLLRKKEEISAWLKKYEIKNYELIPNEEYGYIVNVDGVVDLNNKQLKSIDVKFNDINGWFDCSFNELILLEGCPEHVEYDFYCNNNKLISLKYSPKIVNDSFYCNFNHLKTLEGCTSFIEEIFSATNNDFDIKELKNISIITNNVDFSNNPNLCTLQKITNFEVFKKKVNEILQIKEEKETLLSSINKKNLKNKKENTINKI